MRGFNVKCLCCGEEETVRVDVHNLDTFTCTSCDAEFTREEVREWVDAWMKLFKWLDTAPKQD